MKLDELSAKIKEEVYAAELSESAKDILSGLENLINELWGSGVTGKSYKDFELNELSLLQGDIAMMKTSLGTLEARLLTSVKIRTAKLEWNKAKLRSNWYDEIKEQKGGKMPTQADIDAKADEVGIDWKLKVIYTEGIHQQAKNLIYSSDKLLSALQSRIQILLGERYTTKMAENSGGADFSGKEFKEPKQNRLNVATF